QTSEPFLFQNYVKSRLWIFTCETLVVISLFISKYRVKYLNIFSYYNRNTIVAASSMPFNLIAIAM
ncbi:hypothetical protein, partial [Segatella hominis]|uniref:hypothetical protein n=1 Tax=Segatella hominis TaxID=2518605 RepID=UPI003F81C44F